MDAIVEMILDMPDAAKKVDAISQALKQEHQRRLRFYDEMTPKQKVEFINGHVFMHSPAKWKHIDASGLLFSLLSYHVNRRKLGRAAVEKVLVSLTRNDYEPDICFFRQEVVDEFGPDQMRFPAPDFVVEIISPSTESNDRRLKKRDYAAHGVREYWIIDPDEQVVEQYDLQGGEYVLLGTWTKADTLISTVVSGFQIPVLAIFDLDVNLTANNALAAQADQDGLPGR